MKDEAQKQWEEDNRQYEEWLKDSVVEIWNRNGYQGFNSWVRFVKDLDLIKEIKLVKPEEKKEEK